MEQWKDIPGFEGLYQASTQGRIRTCEGKITSNARYSRRIWKQRILKQKYQRRKTGKGADAKVSLWKDGRERTYLVSRLVALTWRNDYVEGLTVNHIDGDPMNNCAENLEWVTRAENIQKAFSEHLYSTQNPVSLIDATGRKTEFRSMASASRYLGKNDGYISGLLSKGITRSDGGYTIVAIGMR